MMELFAKTVSDVYPFTIFAKNSIIDLCNIFWGIATWDKLFVFNPFRVYVPIYFNPFQYSAGTKLLDPFLANVLILSPLGNTRKHTLHRLETPENFWFFGVSWGCKMCFLVLSGGTKWEHCPEMGQSHFWDLEDVTWKDTTTKCLSTDFH